MTKTKDPIKVAMVGLGVWGRSQMVRSIAESPFVEAVAAYDPNSEEKEAFCKEFGLRPLASFEEILNDKELEAALLFTPNPVHPAQAMALARAGKHAYLTKPIANYAKDGVDMIQTARETDTVLFVDHGGSVTPTVRMIKRHVEAGLIGDVLMAQTNRSVGVVWQIDESSWRFHRETCPGGSAIQVGVYQTATMFYLFGKPVKVMGSASYGQNKATIESALVATVEYENGCRAAFLSSYAARVNTGYLHLFGTEGNLFWGPNYQRGKSVQYIRHEDYTLKSIKPEKQDEIPTPKEQFYLQVRKGRRPEHSLNLALYGVAVVDAGLRSSAEGRAVPIEEVLASKPENA